MQAYGLELLSGFFHDTSIRELFSVFNGLHGGLCNRAEAVALEKRFLSVIEAERKRDNRPSSTAPSGMAFIYCDFERGRYLLLNPDGVMQLFQNWLIYEGELSVQDIRWIEEDRLVLFDAFNIVHQEIYKNICHYSNDSNAFVFHSDTRKYSRGVILSDNAALAGDTIWVCPKCSSVNLMKHPYCVKCRSPRSW